jgi:hypothetical protein
VTKFKVDDIIRLTTSGKTGVVRVVYEDGYWGISGAEYAIEYHDSSGLVYVGEDNLVLVEVDSGAATNLYPRCDCGLGYTRSGGKHSEYCKFGGRTEYDEPSKRVGKDIE